MWFVFALIATLSWGFADLFYKKSTDENDSLSHLKIAVWVGLVMGVTALLLLILPSDLAFLEKTLTAKTFFTDIIKYSPASLSYIISMVIGYAGLRYLEISIISPVQNASGALSAIVMTIYFLIVGKIDKLGEDYGLLDYAGTALIVAGVIALGIVEQRLSEKERKLHGDKVEKKYKMGALALLFPLAYCVFDTIGTAADGIILDDEVGLGLTDIDVLILYGFTFFAAGLGCWVYMLIKNKKPYSPFEDKQMSVAACAEQFGQIFYVFAMSRNPVLAAPMVACYCIVSVILGRIVLKEKLKPSQYACVVCVIVGIALLGISEGLGES
ncbi:MAG: EamA family transporter [Clostridia bacterium]|nr:EamA family transporter [Clostridia bacterium]